MVLDPVGGDRFTDSLRSLNEGGRVLVVGFTEGSIPEVRVNRLLLNNLEVIGAGWGAYAMSKPHYAAECRRGPGRADRLRLTFVRWSAPSSALQRAAEALELIDGGGRSARSCWMCLGS